MVRSAHTHAACVMPQNSYLSRIYDYSTYHIYHLHTTLYTHRMCLNGIKDWPFKSIKIHVSTAHEMNTVRLQSIFMKLCLFVCFFVSPLKDVPNG